MDSLQPGRVDMGKLQRIEPRIRAIVGNLSNASLMRWPMGAWSRPVGVGRQHWTEEDVFFTIFSKMQLKPILRRGSGVRAAAEPPGPPMNAPEE